jgi:hypothetical protein
MPTIDVFKLYDQQFPDVREEHLVHMVFSPQVSLLTMADPTVVTIRAYLSEEFTYNCGANYKNVLNITPPGLQLWDILKDEAQRSVATYGYATKKTFENNTSTNITVKFRIMAHTTSHGLIHGDLSIFDGQKEHKSTRPEDFAQALAAMTMPTVGKNALFNFTMITQDSFAANAIRKIGSKIKTEVAKTLNVTAGKTAFDNTPGMKADNPSLSIGVKSEINNNDLNLPTELDDFTARHPYKCCLSIGNIFKKDFMVVKNFDVTFSKEYYDVGTPLFADFTVTFESLFNAANQMNPASNEIFGSGFVAANNQNLRATVRNK